MKKLFSPKTFLVPPFTTSKSLMIKRTMFTTKVGMALIIKIGEAVPPKIIKASMSFRTLNKPEKQPKDLIAILKNPSIGKKGFRHKEIRKTKCDKEDYDKKICPPNKPCGSITEHKTVSNVTHEIKNTPYGTTYNLDPSTDYCGNKRPQNAKFYHKSHDAHFTQEDSQGTTFLNQIHVIKEIKKHEDQS